MVYHYLFITIKKHFKSCFFILNALKDILQHLKFVNWWIRGFGVFWCHKQVFSHVNYYVLTHALLDDSVWANIKHLDWKTVVFCLLPSMKVKDLKGQYIFERPLNQPYRPKPLKLWDLIVRDRSMLLHFGLCKGPPTRPLTLWTSFSLFLLKRKLELY